MPMVYELGLKLGFKTVSNSSMILQYLMARKVGGKSAHGHKKHVSTPASKKYTPPVNTNTSKHPRVYTPKQSHTTTAGKVTGSHGSSFGVQTGDKKPHHIQQKQRSHSVNTAKAVSNFATTPPLTGAYQAIKPNLPPSVQAAVHSTVGYVRGQLNQPASAAQVHGGVPNTVQKGVYYGTNPATGETKRFDTGGRSLDAQTRQTLAQQGWTISSTPPQTPDSSQYTWSQSQNAFVKKNTTQVQQQTQGGGWDPFGLGW